MSGGLAGGILGQAKTTIAFQTVPFIIMVVALAAIASG
jgi:hypothetical protein